MPSEHWELVVRLPVDRTQLGELDVRAPSGKAVLLAVPCRGKADNQAAIDAKNPKRDPTKVNGDTPSGGYAPDVILPLVPPDARMGHFFLPLLGTSGQALKAKQNGRQGLGVHAGRGNADPSRPDKNLRATHGCLRLYDDDMARIANLVGKAKVKVTITDV